MHTVLAKFRNVHTQFWRGFGKHVHSFGAILLSKKLWRHFETYAQSFGAFSEPTFTVSDLISGRTHTVVARKYKTEMPFVRLSYYPLDNVAHATEFQGFH